MKTDFKFTPSVIGIPLYFVVLLWVIYWINIRFHIDFTEYGIYPRTFSGLKGIFFSPFIHGSIEHLYNNSIPLLCLLAALRYFYRQQTYQVVGYGILMSGFLTWLIGRENYHIGASSLIYVLVSFMFFKGLQTKYYRLVALSFTIILLYGGMVWYVFPSANQTISWEGHLSGFLTGFVFSYFYKTPEYQKQIFYDWEHPDFDKSKDPFMKHFDENGNFVPTPKIEPVWEYFTSNINVIYDFKENTL
ncbi:MAG: rhomboid family intramembrane serine protease [Flavobacterium sp.]|nr:rhomboid family intramembrane serine protease [Flavobacterium sp.]